MSAVAVIIATRLHRATPRTTLMKTLKPILLALLLACSTPAWAQQESASDWVDSEKAAVIRELLALSGSMRMGNEMIGMLLDAVKQSSPDIDPVILDRLKAKMDIRELESEMVAIYDRHFSTEDLRTVLAFYKTDTGRRVLERMPLVMKEGAIAGQQWGMRKEAELVRELEAERVGNSQGEQPPVVVDTP